MRLLGTLDVLLPPGGTPPSDDARDVTRGLFIAGAVSALVAIGMALASAFAGRGAAVRVVAAFAILVALVTGGFPGLMLLSEAREPWIRPAPSNPTGRPAGPNRIRPSSAATRGTWRAPTTSRRRTTSSTRGAELPTENVTAASVDAVASGIEPELYAGTHAYDNGDIVVAWFRRPSPAPCAVARRVVDTEAAGLLVDGGCIYTGG